MEKSLQLQLIVYLVFTLEVLLGLVGAIICELWHVKTCAIWILPCDIDWLLVSRIFVGVARERCHFQDRHSIYHVARTVKGVDGFFPHRRGAWIDLKAAYRVQFGVIPIENIFIAAFQKHLCQPNYQGENWPRFWRRCLGNLGEPLGQTVRLLASRLAA